MREDEFRAWLAEGGAQSGKAIDGRISSLRRIERKLPDLGYAHSSLEDGYAADQFAALLEALSDLRADARNGGLKFRILLPESDAGDRRLSYWQSWLRRYGRFLAGEAATLEATSAHLDACLARLGRDEINAAMEECDEDGVETFLGNHAFGRPRRWIINAEKSSEYPAKAIVATAIGYLSGGPALTARTFYKGFGEDKAFAKLGELGYEITPPETAANVPPGRDAILKAMEECEQLGLEKFLSQYGFGVPRDYWVLGPEGNNRYPAKAILGAAFRYVEGRSPLANTAFSGGNGEQGANTVLRKLGFTIVGANDPDPLRQSVADQIRAFVVRHYFQPARLEGQSEIEIRSGDVHRDMQLENAMPSVCQVLDGSKLAAEAKVVLVDRSGPRASSTVRYRFRLGPSNIVKETAEEYSPMPMPSPTNLILYGPPGTGKTYTTAREAVRLCGEAVPEDRDALMALYRSLQHKGRIGFVTFHQNFAYEDFVEGLRPVTDGGESEGAAGFALEPQDGVFKQMAEIAASNHGRAISPPPAIDRSRKVFKMSLGRSRASEDDAIYQDAIRDGYVTLGWGGEIDWADPRYDTWEGIKERWRQDHPDASGNDPNMSQMYTFRIAMEPGSLVIISDGNRKFRAIGQITGPYEYRSGHNGEYNHYRPVRWLWHGESLPRERIYAKELSQVSAYRMNAGAVNWDGIEQTVASGGDAVATSGEPEPHVLIIDEINRANISKVFGELITLLEPDKRLGMPNALTVRLPYSKTEFGVPANLHVIGTMNTADRSIALLDTALRRRFVFREMAPDPSLLGTVDGIALPAVLTNINERIEYLVDREHRIGHAFFIHCATRAQVDAVMRDKVIPLLQEYFFEDWSRIAAVVGPGFIEGRKLKAPPGMGDLGPRDTWSVRAVFPPDAYASLVGGAEASVEASAEPDIEIAAE